MIKFKKMKKIKLFELKIFYNIYLLTIILTKINFNTLFYNTYINLFVKMEVY